MPPPEREHADELVVRAALCEDLTADEQDRLDADPDLQARVAELAEVVEVAREAPPDDATDQNLDRLWSGIAAEAFGDGDGPTHQGRPPR